MESKMVSKWGKGRIKVESNMGNQVKVKVEIKHSFKGVSNESNGGVRHGVSRESHESNDGV